MNLPRPALGSPRPFSFPEHERTSIPGGLGVVACHLPGRALGAAVLVLDAGAEREPAEQGGLAALTAAALREGTTERDAASFNDALELLGARFSSWSDWEELGAMVSAPMHALPDAVALMAEAVRSPALPDNDIERLRTERLNRLAQLRSHPGARAQMAFGPAVFDPAGLYARDADGEADTVAGLTADDVRSFHAAGPGPAGGTLIVTGDLTGLDVAAMAERAFGGWRAAGKPAPDPVVLARDGSTRITIIDRPGSVQSELVLGHASINRASPDHTALDLALTVLTGKFDSRLMMILREDKGYTYGVRGGVDARRLGGTLAIGAAVDAPHTAESVAIIVRELRRLRADGIDADELSLTKDYLNGVFPLRNETARSIAGLLAEVAIHGLPHDEWERVQAERASMRVDEVAAVCARAILDESLAIVIVGDAEAIRGEVDALGLGPVEVVRD